MGYIAAMYLQCTMYFELYIDNALVADAASEAPARGRLLERFEFDFGMKTGDTETTENNKEIRTELERRPKKTKEKKNKTARTNISNSTECGHQIKKMQEGRERKKKTKKKIQRGKEKENKKRKEN